MSSLSVFILFLNILIASSLLVMSTQLFLDGVPGGSLDLNDSYSMVLIHDLQKHLLIQANTRKKFKDYL